jgi:hypothetical protein
MFDVLLRKSVLPKVTQRARHHAVTAKLGYRIRRPASCFFE